MNDVLTLPRERALTAEDLAALAVPDVRLELIDGSLLIFPDGRAPFTPRDLDDLPDDGWRHELIDGALVMTPGPSWDHQGVVGNLHLLLRQRCPAELAVRFAPLDVTITRSGQTEVFQPDLLVARRADAVSSGLPTAPLLAVEVLSPSTRGIDLGRKKQALERAGCAAYWVVDPVEVRLIAWQLRRDAYVEIADVRGDQEWTSSAPYPVTVCPATLFD